MSLKFVHLKLTPFFLFFFHSLLMLQCGSDEEKVEPVKNPFIGEWELIEWKRSSSFKPINTIELETNIDCPTENNSTTFDGGMAVIDNDKYLWIANSMNEIHLEFEEDDDGNCTSLGVEVEPIIYSTAEIEYKYEGQTSLNKTDIVSVNGLFIAPQEEKGDSQISLDNSGLLNIKILFDNEVIYELKFKKTEI